LFHPEGKYQAMGTIYFQIFAIANGILAVSSVLNQPRSSNTGIVLYNPPFNITRLGSEQPFAHHLGIEPSVKNLFSRRRRAYVLLGQ
jgi:hypothetical protein